MRSYKIAAFCAVATCFLGFRPPGSFAQSSLSEPQPGVIGVRSLEDMPPQLRELAGRSIRDMQSKGYLDRSEEVLGVIRDFRFSRNPLRPIDEGLKKRLTFELAALGKAFEGLKLEGGITEGPPDGPWPGVARYFTAREGHEPPDAPAAGNGRDESGREREIVVRLSEYAYRNTSRGMLFTRESLNEDVRGSKAAYSVIRDPKGNLLGTLSWATPAKIFELEVTGVDRSTPGGDKSKDSLARLRSVVMRLARDVEPGRPEK